MNRERGVSVEAKRRGGPPPAKASPGRRYRYGYLFHKHFKNLSQYLEMRSILIKQAFL